MTAETAADLGRGTRERAILDAAGRLFQQCGFEGTSVARIAKASGMTPANLYWYFPSKQDLLREVLSDLYRYSLETLSAADVPSAAPVERLRTYVRTLVRIQVSGAVDVRFSYLALQSSLEEEASQVISAWQRAHRELLRDILDRGVEDGSFDVPDVSVAALWLATGVEQVWTWYRSEGRLAEAEVADLYAEHALRSVRSPA